MDKARIIQYQSNFDAIAQRIEIEGEQTHIEVWYARELSKGIRLRSVGELCSRYPKSDHLMQIQ